MPFPSSADNIGQGKVLSNDTWKHLVDASSGFVLFLAPDKRILNINKPLANFLGGKPGDFIGKLCYDVIHNTTEPLFDCPLTKLSSSSQVESSLIDDVTFGKAIFKAVPVKDDSGNTRGCLHFIEPVENSGVADIQSVASERAMYSLVNAMPNPTLVCDSNGKITIASKSFIDITGIGDANAITSSNFITFLVPDDIEKALLNFNQVVNGSATAAIDQFSLRRANRESLHSEVSMTPVLNPNQKVGNILLSFRDISGQRDLRESASKNHIRLSRFNQTFLGFSPAPDLNISRLITLLGEMLGASSCNYVKFQGDQSLPLVSWQSPFLFDFTPDVITDILTDLLGNNTSDFSVLLKPQLSPYIQANPALQDKYGIKSILGIAVRSGAILVGYVTLVFTFNIQLKDDDREFCAMIASALALESSRMSASKTSEVTDFNYRELFDFFTDSIYILNPEGVFLDVNSGATSMYGYSREEMIGKNPEMLSAPDKNDLEATNEAIRKAFNGESQILEWWGKRKNGEIFPKDIVLNRGKYFGRDVVIAIGRDISERKQVEEKLLAYNLELRESNQSKDKFFSILAHDLKNPFGGLLGFIDLLYEDIDELSTEQVKEYLQNIRTASYHTYSLLENLLEWSRIQTGKVQFRPTLFDLKDEIESVLLVLEANSIRKNIKLISKVSPGIQAEADRNMIHSVIQNLITNAIKFSNSNSQVIIEGRFLPPDKTQESNDAAPDTVKKWYQLDITDTGIGIPEDIMPKLFKLDGQFSMAGTANEPGTGLGLILCKEMVEKNGGRIWVKSHQNQGSTFSFTLPLAD